jgi:hypothetical protein
MGDGLGDGDDRQGLGGEESDEDTANRQSIAIGAEPIRSP